MAEISPYNTTQAILTNNCKRIIYDNNDNFNNISIMLSIVEVKHENI